MSRGKKLENFRTKDAKKFANALIRICHIMKKRDWWEFNQYISASKDKGGKPEATFKIDIKRIR